MIESVRKFKVFGGILGGKTRDAAGGFGIVIPKKKRLAIGRRGEDTRAGIEDFATQLFDLHVPRDFCAKRAKGMGKRGGLEAGMKFLGDGATTDHFAAFEDEGLEATFGEIKSGDESVVTAADKNHALSKRHGQLAAFAAVVVAAEELDFVQRAREASDHSFKMTWLAMRPLAPMMPPPGWVAEPHI